jgi:hypothetical protein
MSILGLGITSSNQLYNLAKKLNLKINYIGFAENLPKKIINGIYIINLGDNYRFGTHWTLLYIKDNEAFYSDSYAMPPEDYIFDFVKGKNFEYNKDFQLQGIDENYCGVWVIASAYYLKNEKGSLKERFNKFTKHFNNLKV